MSAVKRVRHALPIACRAQPRRFPTRHYQRNDSSLHIYTASGEGNLVAISRDTKIKVLYYLLLSALGVFHAEVLSWSQPTILYSPATFAFVTPVYAVHYILFGDLMGRYRDRKSVLYVFGCLTGMYETFITKVYWSPPWNPEAAGVLGVAWIELLWIGFTWHAFMSFLIPFTLMNRLFTPGTQATLRAKDLRVILLVAPLMGATLGYGFGQSIDVMLVSVLLSLVAIFILAGLFVYGARRWGFNDPRQLAFGRTGRRLAIGAFLAVYIGYGVLLRPEFFPLGLPLVPVLLIYGGLIYLAARLLRSSHHDLKATGQDLPRPHVPLQYLALYLLSFVGIMLALGALHASLPAVLPVAAGLSMYAGAALPVILLSGLALRALRSRTRLVEATKPS